MLKNYLKIAYRNLSRNSIFSLINILGLAIGMAACLLIVHYISYEKSYDQFRSSRLYRLTEAFYGNQELVWHSAQTSPAIAPALARDIPEITRTARLVDTDKLMSTPVMQIEDRSFFADHIYYADSLLPQMLAYQFTEGDITTALKEPQSIVLSESTAAKYFPNQSALNKTIVFHRGQRSQEVLTVTGIFKDIPTNSHLYTDMLVSFSSLDAWNLDEVWDWSNYYTYIQLNDRTDPATVEAKLPAFLERYIGDALAQRRSEGGDFQLKIQPVQDIHLNSQLWGEAEANGNETIVRFLGLIAAFILFIAWINYINLATSRAVRRAKEVGIRKVVGSGRTQLVAQFMAEALLVNLIAMLLAITLSQVLLPTFRTVAGTDLPDALWAYPMLLVGGIAVFLLGAAASGFYPALILSGINPLKAFKKITLRGRRLRQGLIVFQFMASSALIFGTLIVWLQLQYMQNQALGVSLDQTLIVQGPGVKGADQAQRFSTFKQEATRLSEIQQVTVSSTVPGQETSWGRTFYRKGHPDEATSLDIVTVDEDFFSLYGISLAAGRNFTAAPSADQQSVILNETALKTLGFTETEQAIGATILWNENDTLKVEKQVIGVIQDFHQQSLHSDIDPVIFALKRHHEAPWAGEYYALKLPTEHLSATLANVKALWDQSFPGNPFDYFFLDDYFNQQYQADRRFGKVFGLFAGLAIFIACLGLFGLASFTTLQRTQEIGIRKVLGASVPNILRLLSMDFVRLVIIASIIAMPFAYWGMQEWLAGYAYRVSMAVWWAVIPPALILLLALFTIGYQTLRAALANPTDALRYE